MKRILFNSALCACLLAALVSLWIVAYPVKALAASASVTCRDDSTRTCAISGGSCFAHDPDQEQNGFCTCEYPGGPVTVTKTCDNDPPDDPPLCD